MVDTVGEEFMVNGETATHKKSNQTWARLIQKVYEMDPLICPRCGSEMKIR